MYRWEKKMIEWINGNMIYIAIGFVMISAAWMRMGGRNYVGNDYHFALYDIPGNCNSLLFRRLTDFFLSRFGDTAIILWKLLAYAGDFTVAFFTLALLRRKHQKIGEMRTFFILTVCLLSPVSLIYSVSGMKIDSICMSFVLGSILLFRKNLLSPAALALSMAGFLSPAYWPVSIFLLAWMIVNKGNKKRFPVQAAMAVFVFSLCLILSFFAENQEISAGYYWGKVFIIDPPTGENYAHAGLWLLGMCRIYGYFFATGLLLLSLTRKKLRIPALILQMAVIMFMGWQQTSFLAL